MPFLTFEGITHARLLKISITNKKARKNLLHLLIDCISTRPASQTLTMKGECTFRFSSSHVAKSKGRWFDIF